MKPSLATRSGKLISLFDPNPDHFTLQDIAWGLARAMRFAGQIDMTVAQHSVNVRLVVETLGGDRAAQKAALFHDASEFLISDIPRPLKQLLPQYYEVEDKVMQAIAIKFDFQWPLPPVVKKADEMMLVTEARRFLHPDVQYAISPEYGFPADLDAHTVPPGEWLDMPLGHSGAAKLWLDEALSF